MLPAIKGFVVRSPSTLCYAQTYPRDDEPRSTLSNIYYAIGQYERALPNSRGVVIKRGDIDNYLSLAYIYLRLNRLEEARATLKEVQKRKPDSVLLHYYFFELSFLENDAAGMAQQVASSVGTEWEGTLLTIAADTAAYFGQLEKYRDLTRKADWKVPVLKQARAEYAKLK